MRSGADDRSTYLPGLEATAGKGPWYDPIALPRGRNLLRQSVVQASAPWTWPTVRSQHTSPLMEEELLEAETTIKSCRPSLPELKNFGSVQVN